MTASVPAALDRRWRAVPFRARLTLGFALAMVILFGGLALALHVVVESSLDEQINRSLQTRSVDIADLVEHKAEARLPTLPASDGTFAQILQPSTGFVLAATPGHGSPVLDHRQLRYADAHHGLIDHGASRLRVQTVETQPDSLLIVGASLAQRDHTLTLLSEMLFAGGPVLLLLTCLAGYILAARALAPVEKMSEQAATISGAPAGERLPTPEARDEIRKLGDTLNDLLARVEEALARERSFVADASHELRTPLTVLKLELEFALASDISRAELQARVASAAEEVDRLTKVAEDLLFIARVDQGRLPLEKQRTAVEDLLAGTAERFRQPARLRERSVSAEPLETPLFVEADNTWIAQVLNNLVSNALRYGGGPVTLAARRVGDTVALHVLDEGPGFDPAFLECAFERFARSDPARGGVGAGLGLSIVRAIAEAHGGSARAANRPGGGADVWVSIPASPPGEAGTRVDAVRLGEGIA